jgi:asparagine synthase (glutamine-hydrolysing)
MCGICGILSLDCHPIDEIILHRMTIAMKHRGPDGSGTYYDKKVGFGHRRLSIIDIGGGSQPIKNENDDVIVIFNGEIYNYIELRERLKKKGHEFKTLSDTEVIVHGYEEWGVDCVKYFNGMFAFAIWDVQRRRLFLARDHLGIKPLYYTVLSNELLFASEIKALLQHAECPREVDLNSLADLFTYRYVPSPKTLFKNIFKLCPGHYMLCENGEFLEKRYWNKIPVIDKVTNYSKLIDEYQELLEDAIRLQLRSDVPVGLFLSSGIDSNAILAIMNKYVSNDILTFTVGFEDGEKTNETSDARVMAARFSTNHKEMMITAGDYEKYYEHYLWDLEEPVGNESAAAFYFVSKMASEHVKVALTGQGADEPWAGYQRHLGAKLSGLYCKLPNSVTGLLERLMPLIPRNERLKRGVLSLSEPNTLKRFVKIYSFYTDDMRNKLFQGWLTEELSRNAYDSGEVLRNLQSDVNDLDPLSQICYIDTRSNLPDDLLMVNDKTSMANSIETRVPFLDYRLVEFIEAIPPGLKIHGFEGKYLHKKAVEKWLPKEMIYKKKKGFANPVDKWLRGRMKQCVEDCLMSKDSAVNKYFDQSYMKKIVTAHEQRREDYMRHIYLLVSFELWNRKFIALK